MLRRADRLTAPASVMPRGGITGRGLVLVTYIVRRGELRLGVFSPVAGRPLVRGRCWPGGGGEREDAFDACLKSWGLKSIVLVERVRLCAPRLGRGVGAKFLLLPDELTDDASFPKLFAFGAK
jgi:hypothetical protein